jgi:hypothetical protein
LTSREARATSKGVRLCRGSRLGVERVEDGRAGEPLPRAYGFAVAAVWGWNVWRMEEPEKLNAVQYALCAANVCAFI